MIGPTHNGNQHDDKASPFSVLAFFLFCVA